MVLRAGRKSLIAGSGEVPGTSWTCNGRSTSLTGLANLVRRDTVSNSSSACAYGGPDWATAKYLIHAGLQGALVYRQQTGDRIDGLLDGCSIMGGAHDERRCKNPAVCELLQHQCPKSLTGLPVPVASQVGQVAVPSSDLKVRAKASVGDDLFDPAAQFAADLVEALGDPLALAAVDDGQHGRQRPRLRAGGLR